MIASEHEVFTDIADLRLRFSVSLKGATLDDLMTHGAALGFTARPLQLELDELQNLLTPCILHWDLNHFVVLTKVSSRSVYISDPAVGPRKLAMAAAGEHFTGIALELTPSSDFRKMKPAPRLKVSELTGAMHGIRSALLKIFFTAIVLELFTLIGPLLSQLVIDDVLASGDLELLTMLAIGFGLMLLIQVAISVGRSWMVMVFGQAFALQWNGNMFSHLIKLPLDFFEKRHVGDISSRFGSVDIIQKTLTSSFVEAVLDGVMALAALVVMLLYSVPLALITCAAVFAYGLLRYFAYRPLRNATSERLILAARANTHFLETLRAMVPIKLFGKEEPRRARWQNLIVEVQNRDIRTARLSILFTSANTLIFGIESIAIFWAGATLVSKSHMGGAGVPSFTVGMLLAYIGYKTQFSSRIAGLIDYWAELKMLSLHGERLADIALAERERSTLFHGSALKDKVADLEPSIELRDVSFRYGDGEEWVVRHLNFRIEANSSVAITGPSGCGKTTLLKLMLGLLHPTEGEIIYGGVTTARLGVSAFRQQVGTVMQEDCLLSGTIADNVSFFDVRPDLEHVAHCLKLAQLTSDLAKMPMGIHSFIGDLGSGLSGGQKQRILLARALYKRPRVLALDEATSHLDVSNERAVAQALAQMTLTRIVVAHRPETIAGAQRTVQIRDGMVHEVVRSLPVEDVAEALAQH